MTSYLWRLGLAAYKMHPGIAQHITQMMMMTILKNRTTPNTAPTRMPMILSTVRQEKWLLSGGKVMKEISEIQTLTKSLLTGSTEVRCRSTSPEAVFSLEIANQVVQRYKLP